MHSYDKYVFSKNQNIIIYSLIIFFGLILSLLFYRSVIFAVIILPFAKKIKSWIGEKLIEKRCRELLEQFKDFLFIASTSIGSGHSMKDAVRESIPEIISIYGEDAILVKELEVIDRRMNQGHESDVDVLMEFAVRSKQEDIIDFVTIYSTCKRTGASLILALNRASSVIIDKMTIEKEIREIVRTKRNEGLVIFAMPFAIIVFLNLFSPDYISPLYTTWIGRVIMTGVVVMNVFIYSIIRKIIKVDI